MTKEDVSAIVASIFVVTAFLFISSVITIQLIRKRASENFVHCWQNLRDIGMALEMYSTDNQGDYPISMPELMPEYLKKIPVCPEAGIDTYSVSYESSENHQVYTFFCRGENHRNVDLPANEPVRVSFTPDCGRP